MNYSQRISEARRLGILLALFFCPSYMMNRAALREQVARTGYTCSTDLFAIELKWLADAGLVDLLELDAVRLTPMGADVALARCEVPGVRKPLPGEGANGAS
jgi:hypothetical protein